MKNYRTTQLPDCLSRKSYTVDQFMRRDPKCSENSNKIQFRDQVLGNLAVVHQFQIFLSIINYFSRKKNSCRYIQIEMKETSEICIALFQRTVQDQTVQQRLSNLSVQLISETISQILSLLGLDEVVTHVSLGTSDLCLQSPSKLLFSRSTDPAY